jgi:hypothetical protein
MQEPARMSSFQEHDNGSNAEGGDRERRNRHATPLPIQPRRSIGAPSPNAHSHRDACHSSYRVSFEGCTPSVSPQFYCVLVFAAVYPLVTTLSYLMQRTAEPGRYGSAIL